MINKIWIVMIVLGIVYSIISGDGQYLYNLILEIPAMSLNIFMAFAPLIIFWSGIMGVAKASGFLKAISKLLSPVVNNLFKGECDETKEYISANIAANMLGLGSCATPLGLSAMKKMQERNKDKKVATNSMTKLLLINTSGLTLIPTYIISIRSSFDISALDVTLYIIMATTISTISAFIIIKVAKL